VEEQTDKVFIKSFSLVVAALIVVAIVFAFIANSFKSPVDDSQDAARIQKIEERIKPVAGAYTDANAVAAAEKTAPAQAQKSPEQSPAPFGGRTDGETVFNNVCSACHATGAAGAPKPGSPEMSKRSEKGFDALFQSAANGLNAMPPRGGRPDLTDEQIKAAIEFMTK